MGLIRGGDLGGARAIEGVFLKEHLSPPRQVLVGRHFWHGVWCPFEIVMGTCLQADMVELQRRCGGWLRISLESRLGPMVLSLHRQVLEPLRERPQNLHGLRLERDDDFYRIIPQEQVCESVEFGDGYGLVLKLRERSDSAGRHRTKWYVAGFSDAGTRAASEYLVRHWEMLFEKHADRDFFMFVQALYHPTRSVDWRARVELTEEQMDQLQHRPWKP